MTCAVCGSAIALEAAFCGACGAPGPAATPEQRATWRQYQARYAPPRRDPAFVSAPKTSPLSEPGARRGRKLVVLIVAGLALLLAIGYSAGAMGSGSSATHTIDGNLGTSYVCTAQGQPLAGGSDVTVLDQDDRVVGSTSLREGEWRGALGCSFPLKVDVSDASFYTIRVTGKDVFNLTYSKDELERKHWSISPYLHCAYYVCDAGKER
jgi:hypothetical protein